MNVRHLIERIPGAPAVVRVSRELDAWYREYRRGRLRVFIAGAPKTGNMWLKHLLSAAYDLPMVDVTGKVFPVGYPTQRRYISHEHLKAKEKEFAWGQRYGVHFITMLRHPADTFLSLYHYMNTFVAQQGAGATSPCQTMIGQALDSPATFEYLRSGFHADCLDLSIQWVRSGKAIVVRYEDLHLDPEAVLVKLGEHLGVIPMDSIRRAIEQCRFENLQKSATGPMKMHYRQGRMGSWKKDLPAAHRELIRKLYSDEIEFLGYNLDV